MTTLGKAVFTSLKKERKCLLIMPGRIEKTGESLTIKVRLSIGLVVITAHVATVE